MGAGVFNGLEVVPEDEQGGAAIQCRRVAGVDVNHRVAMERTATEHPGVPLCVREQGAQAAAVRVHPRARVQEGPAGTVCREDGEQAAADAPAERAGESTLVRPFFLYGTGEC